MLLRRREKTSLRVMEIRRLGSGYRVDTHRDNSIEGAILSMRAIFDNIEL